MNDLDRVAERRIRGMVANHVETAGGLNCDLINSAMLNQLMVLVDAELKDRVELRAMWVTMFEKVTPIFEGLGADDLPDIDRLDEALKAWVAVYEERWGTCLAATLGEHLFVGVRGLLHHTVPSAPLEEWIEQVDHVLKESFPS